MKRFRYSLETLLRLRREKEQEQEIALARVVGELAEIDRRIKEAGRSAEEAFLESPGDLNSLRLRELVLAKSYKDRQDLEKPRQAAFGRMEKVRKQYTKAHAQRLALERLREKRLEQWKIDVGREETLMLDEVAKGALVRKGLMGGM